MTIRYEINPPKTTDPPSRIDLLDERIEHISKHCDGIHVTDSVLGIERISPLIIGTEIKQKHPELQVTISLRVIDTVSYTHLPSPRAKRLSRMPSSA